MANLRRSTVQTMTDGQAPRSAASRQRKSRTVYVALLAAVVGATSLGKAATLSWDPGHTPATPSGGAGTWNLALTNWSNSTGDVAWTDVSPTGTDLAVFGGSAGAVTLNTSLSALGLQFLTPNYTISGTGSLTFGASGIDASTIFTGTTSIGNNIIVSAAQTWNVGSTLNIGGVISSASTFAITKAGGGSLILSGANTYSGATLLTAGKLIVANPAALASTSGVTASTGTTLDLANDGGDSPFTYSFGTGTNATIASDVKTGNVGINHVVSTVTVGGGNLNIIKGTNVTSGASSLTINNFGLTSGTAGAITVVNPTTATVSIGNVSITSSAVAKTIALDGTNTGNTVTGVISNGLSTLSVTKSNSSTWTLSNSNTYTGATTILGGKLIMSGANGATTGATAYTFGGGTFVIDNTTAAGGNNNARIANTSSLGLSGGTFLYKGADAAGTNSTETVGAINGAGSATFTVAFGGTNTATITAASFTHAAGNASDFVNGVNLGLDSTGTASESRILLTAAPTLTGTTPSLATGINAASQNTSIVPFLVGEAATASGGAGTATGVANTFMTYNATTGLRPLNPTDEFTTNALVATNNTYLTATTEATASLNINSLVVNGGGLSIDDGATVTVTSGAVLFASNSAIAPSATTGALAFGGEGLVTVDAGITGTISSSIAGGNALTKGGAGTLALTGNNTYTGATTVAGGVLTTSGTNAFGAGVINIGGNGQFTVAGGSTTLTGQITAGLNVAGNGVLNVTGGTLNANKTGAPSIQAGGNSGINGAISISGGNVISTSELWLATADNGYGSMRISGGNVTVGSWLALARGGGQGVMDVSGGSLIINGNPLTIGSFGGATTAGVIHGLVNVSGGSITSNVAIYVGEQTASVLNISGTGVVNAPGGQGTVFSQNVANTGVINLLGGTLNTSVLRMNLAGNSSLNFNGGTLKASTSNANFLTGLTAATVYSGGATIDDGGNTITVGQSLLAPTGNGVSATGLTVSGGGYIGEPIIQITGGGGTGATAVANVDANGNFTGVTITNPGQNYTSAPTFVLVGGGIGNTGALGGVASLVPNSSGSLTKQGSGTTTFTGTNTYTGSTQVIAGDLALIGSGTINTSSGISINGSGARFTQASVTPIIPTVTVTNGTLDGNGTVNTAVVGNGTGGIVSNGVNGNGTLTVNSLTFNGAATLNLTVSSQTSPVLNTTSLITSGGGAVSTGKIAINVSNTSPWTAGAYELVDYSTLGGVGFSDFTKGVIVGLGGRQTAVLTSAPGFIDLTISGDNPRWTGALNGNWTTATLGSPKNWAFIGSGAPTDYVQGDNVLFDDNAAGTTAVSISDADVSPNGVTFANAGKAYTINGPFGIAGPTAVQMNGTGTVTFANANSYSGGTILNSTGTFNINNAGALGTGVLRINANATIDNTSGAPITLSTNTAQVWNADFSYGGTNDLNLGTGAIVLPGQRTITTNGTANLTLAGVISGGFGISTAGSGNLVLTGVNTYTGTTIVGGTGTLTVAGGVTGTLTTGANSDIQISPTSTDFATLQVTGGVVNANRIIIGGNSANNGAPGSGKLVQTGGVINSAEWFTVGSGVASGASFPAGEYDISGGTLNVLSQALEIANFDGASGVVNISGGSINLENNIAMNLGANPLAFDGTVNQTGGNVTFYSNAGTTPGGTGIVSLGRAASLSGTYTYNLSGGTLTVNQIAATAASGGTSIFNFNGGTLKAPANITNWITGINQLNIMTGPAIIDDGGHNATITMPITDGSGVDGGLTKQGVGNLTLTAASTYNGPTIVNAGRLVLSGTGSVNGSSGITINTGGRLAQISTTAVTPTVTVNSGGIAGGSNATLNSVVVNSGGAVANGNNDTGVLTIGSLNFASVGTINVTLAGATATTNPGIVTTTLTTSNGSPTSAGKVTVNAINAIWNNGSYDLVGYSTLTGPGFSDFSLGTVTGLTPRQNAVLTNLSGEIALTISGGNIPVWTGALNNHWTTAVLASPKNWNLQTGGAATDFLNGDIVIFDDTATAAGANNVNISDANVSPTSTTFNNSVLNYTLSSTGTFGIASGFIVKNGSGALTITTANTYAGGTILNAGTLNVNKATALGTGLITINGGTLDNTSGAAIVSTTNNPVNVNGNFTFTGTGNLSLGTGAVTLTGTNPSNTITVAAGNLKIGTVTSAALGLTKDGPGILTINATAASNIAGTLNVVAGTLQIGAQDFHAAGLTGAGTIENGSATTRWLFVANTANQTFSGVLQDGSGGGRLGLNKNIGNGTLTLTGNNTYSDATNVGNGTLVFSGNTNNVSAVDNIGNIGGENGVLIISPGSTFGANDNPGQFTSVLAIGGNATSAGDVRMSGATSTLNIGAQFGLGTGTGGYAAFTQTGGTTNSASFVVVGFNNDKSVYNMSGGALNIASNLMTIAAGGTGSVAVTSVSGGTITSVNTTTGNPGTLGGIFVGETGNGTLNVSGTANLVLAGRGITFANAAGAIGMVNLLGGTINTNIVAQGPGASSTFNFNGGVLKATGSSANFMQGLTSANVYSGGAIIDDGGNAITVNQPLLAATGGGVTSSGLTVSGTGFIDTPIIQIAGDGTGATAVGVVDASGNLTGITITNPGQNYTSASFSVLGGGVGSTATFGGTAAIVANGPGGLTKNGSGSLTLTAANTYTGNTVVNAGTLFVNNTTGSGTGTANVTLNGGTLGGSGIITGSITPGTAAHAINPGATAGTAGTLTVGGLTTNSNTTLSFDLASPTGTNDLLAVAGNIALSGGKLAVTSQSVTGLASLGYYKVVSYSGTLTGSRNGIVLPAASANVLYTLDTIQDAGFIDIHRGFIGDANDDGKVDLTDLNAVLNNLGTSNPSWSKGNFDGAATIDLTDLNDVLNNLGTSIASTSAVAAVATPEPTSLGILALGAAALIARRRKA